MFPMKRFIAATSALLLVLLGAQLVLAQYTPSGPLKVSSLNPQPGAAVTVAGDGFAPDSEVRVTIESTPVLLATTTADGSGAFSISVTIPAAFSGSHRLVATGTDADGSVRLLATSIIVGVPATDTLLQSDAPIVGSDPFVLALAGIGIVVMTTLMLFVGGRRGSRR
jgi:hypothetical protein